ncbi:MAG: hypothetical protein Q4C73_09260 [Eubacteriales bacterium]|nr:hypothetical protein [Eubacteriales bacterium]
MELAFFVNDDASQSKIVMVDDKTWEEFSFLCRQQGHTPADVIEYFFAWAVHHHDAALVWLREARDGWDL